MARSISFAYTTPALVAGHKTVTRRHWDEAYAHRFKAGDDVVAYDRSPRQGGKPVARLRLTQDVRLEPDADAPDSDYDAEGFAFLYEAPGKFRSFTREDFAAWREEGGSSHVVRFEVLEIYER
jgi:hypothetical protein